MREFKINRNKKSSEPADELIAKHQNFGRFYHDYERLTKRSKKPVHRDPKLYLLMVLIAVILYLILSEE
jgi:hypothetical protein